MIRGGGALLILLLVWGVLMRALPNADKLLNYEPALPSNVRGLDGVPVSSFAREQRVELAFYEFPKQLVNAYISAEDKTFFSHGGIDYPGLAGAVFDYVTKLGSGKRARGGSTITQQVAKNLLLSDEYSISRKLREAILAYRIESVLTKQQIMELYLNQIFLGRNAYGVQSASRAYFDKDVSDLQLHEMAYLAILPKAPSNYSPERYKERALIRRNWVLKQMRENGFITTQAMQAAQAMPLSIVARAARKHRDIGGYFLEEVRRQLIASYGENSKTSPNSVYDGGLWVRTSLDPKAQVSAEQALRAGLMRYDNGKPWKGPEGRIDASDDKWASRLAAANIGSGSPDWRTAVVLGRNGLTLRIGFADGSTGQLPEWGARFERRGGGIAFSTLKSGDVIPVAKSGNVWTLQRIPEVSGGMVAEQVATGRVIAMQGGFATSGNASFNRATQALRQPGSTIKPFVYASALDHGMTPASIIVDGPFCIYQSARLGQKCFRNFDNKAGAGPQTMRWGVEQSRNLMTVRAATQTGMENVVKTISGMGIGDYQPVLSMSLGAGETTVMKLTNAYAMLANGGRKMAPTLIDYIQDRRGRVIFRVDERCKAMRNCSARDWNGQPMPRPPARFTKQALDPMTAYQVVHILEGVVQRGTATVLRDLNRPLFGKTGTSSGPTNVWFVGGSADIVAGVYIGYDQPRSLGGYAQGGTVAAPIFKQFARNVFAGMDVVPFRAPAGIRMVRIDRRSGRKVFGTWPTDDPKAPVIWEAFKPESEPIRSIRRDELKDKKVEKKTELDPQAARQSRDSQFLDRTEGIY